MDTARGVASAGLRRQPLDDKIIEKYYIKYNFPNQQKLYRIMRDDDIDITHKQIKEYLNEKVEAQLLKINKPLKKREGHIVAITYKDNAQMDIYDLSKYKNYNKGYKYILTVIDVFTRKAFVEPMKSKNSIDVITALNKILERYNPYLLTTDTDKAFISKMTQDEFIKNDIIHDTVIARDDHKALSIIDRFARTLKTILSKMYIINNNLNWVNHIYDVVDKYNNTPHSSLDELTPNEATKEINQHNVAELNRAKISKEQVKPLFSIGDTVRVRINKTFRKGTEPRYSNDIYTVEEVQGQRITLNNGKTLLESELLKVDDTATSLTTNPIDTVNKENRTARRLKQAGVIQSDIVEGKRERKPNKRYL
jgi:transposase InsO family protein